MRACRDRAVRGSVWPALVAAAHVQRLGATTVDAAAAGSSQAGQQSSAGTAGDAAGDCITSRVRVRSVWACCGAGCSCHADMYSCIRTPVAFSVDPADRRDLTETELSTAKVSLAQRVEALGIDSYLATHPPPYDVYTFAHLPTRQCNLSAVAEYQAFVKANGQFVAFNEADKRYLDEALAANTRVDWRRHAIDTLHAVIQAFELVRVPLVVQHGTLLGWYRQCDMMAHTEDLDFFVPPGYITSMTHFELLQVLCCCL